MKVLVSIPDVNLPGGVGRYFCAIRPYLPEDVAFFEIGRRPAKKSFLDNLIRIIRDYLRFYRIVIQEDIRLIHLNPSLRPRAVLREAIFVLIGHYCRRRVLVFFHGWNREFASTLFKYWRGVFRFFFFRATAMIVLAQEYRWALMEVGFQRSVFVETTVVDDSLGSPKWPDKLKQDKTPELNLLYLARIEKAKGIYELVDAFEHLSATGLAGKLAIAGDGPELSSVRRYVERLGLEGVSFLGFVTGAEKRKAFEDSHVYLLLSKSEGMPISLLEAMTSGLPIITTAVGGIKDFFENGRMGFIASSLKPQVVAALIQRLAVDETLRKSISRYNRWYASKFFSASTVSKRLLGIYQQVLGMENCPLTSVSQTDYLAAADWRETELNQQCYGDDQRGKPVSHTLR